MIKRRIVRAALGIALTTASSMAAAETTTGWYFGVTGGKEQADINQADLDTFVESELAASGFPVVAGSATLDHRDTSWSVVGGYRFSRYFSVEGSYIDFGSAEYRVTGAVDPPGPVLSTPLSYTHHIEATGFTAAAVGSAPIGEMFELHAQGGVVFTDADITERTSISGLSGTASRSTDSRDLFFGFGAGLHFAKQWVVSLDWQLFKHVGDKNEPSEADIERISLGLIYRL